MASQGCKTYAMEKTIQIVQESKGVQDHCGEQGRVVYKAEDVQLCPLKEKQFVSNAYV